VSGSRSGCLPSCPTGELSTSSGDFDASVNVLFETSAGKVVTVDYASDNATTLGKMNVCTVYGSFVAS
jgi:hypothetical protein